MQKKDRRTEQTKEIERLALEFNSHKIVDDFTSVYNAAVNGPLRGKHFSIAKKMADNLLNATPLQIFWSYEDDPMRKLSERTLDMMLIYMGIRSQPDKSHTANDLLPAVHKVLVRQDFVGIMTRPFPVCFSSEHIETRHIERVGRPLDYDSGEFILATSFSLALARVLERADWDNAKHGLIPVNVPNKQGLYTGYARLCHPEDYRHAVCQYSSFDANMRAARVKNHNDGQHQLLAEWVPKVEIDIRTFLSADILRDGQLELHQEMLKYLDSSQEYVRSLSRNVDLYALGWETTEVSIEEQMLRQRLYNSIESLVKSDVWQNNVQLPSKLQKALDKRKSIHASLNL